MALAILGASAVAAVSASEAVAGTASVPKRFIGVMADGPVVDGVLPLETELRRMAGAGAGSVRVPLHWSVAQPYASWDEVPPSERDDLVDVGGIPTDFSFSDRVIGTAARTGLHLLPVVVRTPTWARIDPDDVASPPRDPSDFARYLAALARRYGARGSVWRGFRGPRRPMTAWQVWNEPDLRTFWRTQPFQQGYVELLRAARPARRSADPRARLVLAGLTIRSWEALQRIYAAGGKGLFDAAAIHPFTREPQGIVEMVKLTRRVMRQYGDNGRELLLTEISWTSGGRRSSPAQTWLTTPRGQARRLEQAYTLLARVRHRYRIGAAYWYTWVSRDRGRGWTPYAGLRHLTRTGRTVPKPAFDAYRRIAHHLAN
jgi:hypothetical protein